MIFYWFPMLIGRILSIFLTALWISPELMLSISLLFCVLTYLFWLIFLWYIGLTRLSVFILVTLNGFSISSIFPTTIGWMKQFPIELTFLLTSNAAGGIGFGFICGYVFQHYNPKHLFTILIIAVLSTSILFLLSFIFQNNHSKKIKKNQSIQQKDNTLDTFIKHHQENNS